MKFITNYVSGMSRAEAYHAAYNTKSLETARISAFRLCNTNDNIQAEIDRLLEEKTKATIELIKAEQRESIQTIIQIRDHAPIQADRLRAAKELAYMAGHKPTDKIDMSQHGLLEINIIAPEGVDIDKLN